MAKFQRLAMARMAAVTGWSRSGHDQLLNRCSTMEQSAWPIQKERVGSASACIAARPQQV
jgi:hypothetical protein